VKPAVTGSRAVAFDLFREKAAIEDVMHQTERTRSTIMDYLAEFIRQERVDDISAWVPKELYDQVAAAARQVGSEPLKPIFIALGEKIPYDVIRLVVTHVAK
jgi:ATP-dependent DNA helicase RecQ